MATRFYLPKTASATGISPTADADWEDTSLLARVAMTTTSVSDAMATVSFSDGDDTSKDVLFRQYVSAALTGGQTISELQAIKAQARCTCLAGYDMRLTVGIRVIAGDGTTVRKTVLAVTRDGTVAATSLTNRQFTATSAAGDYTTNADGLDRLVIEVGMGGDPTILLNHGSSLRLGDAAASDLPEDDTDTTDLRPWVELADTLTFGGGGEESSTLTLMPQACL